LFPSVPKFVEVSQKPNQQMIEIAGR